MSLVAHTYAPAAARSRRRPSQVWLNLLDAAPRLWRQRIAARRELAQASARDLRDAGISPTHAAFEAGQPFWRPMSRLRD